MADDLGRVPVATEVDAFEGEVRSDEQFAARGKAKHGAVVANTGAYSGASMRKRSNPRNQGFFRERHGEHTIAETRGGSQNVKQVKGLREPDER
jgi:hypothetical protein